MDRSAWRIAVLFAGAALGGSYFSGNEWLRFFAYFGSWGTIGLAAASIGLGWIGCRVLVSCHRQGVRTLHDLLLHWFGPTFAPTFSVLIHLSLLAYAGATAGMQAMQHMAGAWSWLFVLAPLLLAVVVVSQGWTTILRGTAASLAAGLLMLGFVFAEQRHVPIPSLGYQFNALWLIQAVLYLSLHLLVCLVVVLPLATRAPRQSTIRAGVLAGTLFFFFASLLGQAILLAHWHDVHSAALPLAHILASLMPFADLLHLLLALGHAGLILGALVYAMAVPVAVRHDLHMGPLLLAMLAGAGLFALLPLVSVTAANLAASSATYCGLLLLGRLLWKGRKPRPKPPA
ncbi:MAG: hypothetical protein DF221_13860 [Brevibacillus sp.]|jgi:uncharacterized membrane protein YkvI|nr:MAG: hypothetical protein DF221_13860 [Brevibacillus sp.]